MFKLMHEKITIFAQFFFILSGPMNPVFPAAVNELVWIN